MSCTIIPTRYSRRLLGQRRVDFRKVDVGIRAVGFDPVDCNRAVRLTPTCPAFGLEGP